MEAPQFRAISIGSVNHPEMSHSHIYYPMGGGIQEDVVSLEMPEFKAHDEAIRQFMKYINKHGGRRKPPQHLFVKIQETYEALQMAMGAHVMQQVGGFNRRALAAPLNCN